LAVDKQVEMSAKTRRLAKSRRRAWVTGASSGIGAAFARRLARDGFDLALVARSRGRLEKLAGELRGGGTIACDVVPADLTVAAHLQRVADLVAGDGALERMVNNAGFGTAGAFARLDAQREEEEIRLNVVALTRLTRAALPGMIERGRGAVINVSSMAAFQPAPLNATYGATKAYVNSFTEALYEELRGSGVQVQALCPGFTRTEFQERAGIDVQGIPSFAWMSAEDVVDASLAALKSGEVICVPGAGNRLLAAAASAMPRAVVRRIIGEAIRRFLDD
jgi:short-subunit dehydrogenase